MTTPKKFERDVSDAKLGGVCAGVAQYLNVDTTLVRVLAVVLAILTTGTAVLVYLAMWLLMPARPASGVPATVPATVPASAPPANPPETR